MIIPSRDAALLNMHLLLARNEFAVLATKLRCDPPLTLVEDATHRTQVPSVLARHILYLFVTYTLIKMAKRRHITVVSRKRRTKLREKRHTWAFANTAVYRRKHFLHSLIERERNV